MGTKRKLVESYALDIQELLEDETTREETYYPALKDLLEGVLEKLKLPVDVRQNTQQGRQDGGYDLPDLAMYDADGEYLSVCLEVKRPDTDLEELVESTARNNQMGRYLRQTQVVVATNLREFAIVTPTSDWDGESLVAPEHRRVENRVALWPSAAAFRAEDPPSSGVEEQLSDLVEQAATRYAPIAHPETLARVLARQAKRAKTRLPDEFTDAVQPLADDFAEALGIEFEGDRGIDFFRSSLIQTVYYGLFASWILWVEEGESDAFRWRDVATNLQLPFLGQLFHEIQHPQRISELRLRQPLDVATETLERVNQDQFFEYLDVPTLGGDEDPERSAASAIVYFYEPFLDTLDPKLREEMGVWYTPPSVVKYQVHQVEKRLHELGCERGFADENVVVLDPACGTGAYLIEVVSRIAETLREEGVEDGLALSLLEALQNRVLGFEILTAPFVVAHLQLHLLLSSLGITPDPEEDKRPGVYLTNALTGWKEDDQLDLNFPELKEEREAARKVKTETEIIVILGNPPYDRFTDVPIHEDETIIDQYKGVERDEQGNQVGPTELYSKWGIRKQVLEDLYLRFFRIADEQIGEHANHGVVSLITNNSFLRGRSHPVMRESLLSNFDSVRIDNLNGDKRRTGKVIPSWAPGAGRADQSIFSTDMAPGGIKPGVSVTTLVKDESRSGEPAKVLYRNFWGAADGKREALLELVGEKELPDGIEVEDRPQGPREYTEFLPSEEKRWKLVPIDFAGGYEKWYSIADLFPESERGVNPNRGISGSVIAVERRELENRFQDYFSNDLSFPELREKHPVLCESRARYDPEQTWKELQNKSEYSEDSIKEYAIFPLDRRFIYYEKKEKLLNEHRPGLGKNLGDENEFLVAVPQARQESEVYPVLLRGLFDHHFHDRGSVGFPVEVEPGTSDAPLFDGELDGDQERRANLSPDFWQRVQERWGVDGGLESDTAKQFARDLFRACLAICHAPAYIEEHRQALGETWAHVPLPKSRDVLDDLVEAGDTVSILLDPLANPRSVLEEVLGDEKNDLAVLKHQSGEAINREDLLVTISHFGSARGGWRARTDAPEGQRKGDLWINDEVYFRNVPEEVWEFRLGGYPVIKKWLGYRDQKRTGGEPLTPSQKDELREIIQRIAALLDLHPTLDQLYESALEDPWEKPG
jgi:hypothetical protein